MGCMSDSSSRVGHMWHDAWWLLHHHAVADSSKAKDGEDLILRLLCHKDERFSCVLQVVLDRNIIEIG